MGTTLSIFLQFRISVLSYIFLITISTVYSCVINNTSPAVWKKEDYPNPQIDIDRCGRNCTESWICDPDRILSIDQADRLDRKIEEIAVSGNCGCSECEDQDGYNISIALLSQFSVPQGSDNNTEAKVFTEYLRKTWSYQKCGNNVVILVSRDNRQVYTSAGPNAYNILTLTCIEQVYKEVKPVLSRGDYGDALYSMLIKYQDIFNSGGCSPFSVNGLDPVAIGMISLFCSALGLAILVPVICVLRMKLHFSKLSTCSCLSRKNCLPEPPKPAPQPAFSLNKNKNIRRKQKERSCLSNSNIAYSASKTPYTSTSGKYNFGVYSSGKWSTFHSGSSLSCSNSAFSSHDNGFSGGCSSDGGGGGGGDF